MVLHIKEIAKESFGIKFITDACSFEIKQFIHQIIFLENQIDEVGKEIKELYNKLDSHLLSVPGVGVNLAPIILAEIKNINNFDKPSKLIAVGISRKLLIIIYYILKEDRNYIRYDNSKDNKN